MNSNEQLKKDYAELARLAESMLQFGTYLRERSCKAQRDLESINSPAPSGEELIRQKFRAKIERKVAKRYLADCNANIKQA